MITILSDNKKQNIGKKIYKQLEGKGMDANFISVEGLDIKPCYSCGGCSTKTYGTCIIKDDMDRILRLLVRTDRLIIVTPLTWGSYSSNIKKVLDRTCVIGDLHYYVVKGELRKKMRSNMKEMFAVGIKNSCSKDEKNSFENLFYENINIMNIKGKAFVIEDESEVVSITEEICR